MTPTTWYFFMAVFSGTGFGLAAYYASGNQIIGLDVFLGVACFIHAMISGIRLSTQNDKER